MTPQRTCIGCRGHGARSELLRLVLQRPSDVSQRWPVVVDESAREPGRGAWLHPVASCFTTAVQRRTIARALRATAELDLSAVREWFDHRANH